jgi:hypothetical protein
VTAPVEPDATPPLPTPRPPSVRPAAGGRARNFLSGPEQRRLFWRLMPPAILLLVGLEWLRQSDTPPSGSLSQPPIDTRIEAILGPQTQPGTVRIEPFEPVAAPFVSGQRGASPETLARVRDVAFFRRDDHPAWGEIFATLQTQRGSAAAPPGLTDVSFGELMGMARSFRGRPVRIRGVLRRLEQLPPPAQAAEVGPYWQGWLEPADGPAAPVIVHLRSLPTGMATGLTIHEPVTIDGYFLKTMAYRAADGVRVAPLVLAAEPLPTRVASDPATGGFWARFLRFMAAVTLVAVVAILGLGFLAAGRGRRRLTAPPDLAGTLAGFEPLSPAELLRRAAAADEGNPDGDSV